VASSADAGVRRGRRFGEGSIKIRQQLHGRLVGHVPQNGNYGSRAGIEECASQTSDAVARDPAEASPAGTEHHEVGMNVERIHFSAVRRPLPLSLSVFRPDARKELSGLVGFLGNYELLFERPGNEPVRVQVNSA